MSDIVAAYWPDGDWTICEVNNMYDLFWALDSSGSPSLASVRLLPKRFWLSVSKDNDIMVKTHSDDQPLSTYPKVPIIQIHELVDKHADNPREILHTWSIKRVLKYIKRLKYLTSTGARKK